MTSPTNARIKLCNPTTTMRQLSKTTNSQTVGSRTAFPPRCEQQSSGMINSEWTNTDVQTMHARTHAHTRNTGQPVIGRIRCPTPPHDHIHVDRCGWRKSLHVGLLKNPTNGVLSDGLGYKHSHSRPQRTNTRTHTHRTVHIEIQSNAYSANSTGTRGQTQTMTE